MSYLLGTMGQQQKSGLVSNSNYFFVENIENQFIIMQFVFTEWPCVKNKQLINNQFFIFYPYYSYLFSPLIKRC